MILSLRPGLPSRLAGPALALALAGPAAAQMQLPGAVAPTEAGAVASPTPAAKPKPKGPPPPPKIPSEDTLLNRTIQQNGRAGALQFARDGAELRVSKLTLPGERMSRASEQCAVDAPTPVALQLNGRPHGLTSYKAAIENCPIEFDVLEGAVLVAARPKACEFPAADCRVDPAGLWGQPASEIGANRAKEIERARNPAEQNARENFRAWIEAVGKDRDLVRRVSREQAGFSSRRAEVCASYAREAEHGYCSLLLTQARGVTLASRTPPPPEEPGEPQTRRRTQR